MPRKPPSLPVSLFYSYSHEDTRYREDMEKTLSTLKNRGYLTTWDDTAILPGQQLDPAIRTKLSDADIIAFLFSPSFLASKPCISEWEHAQRLESSGRLIFRVPIIVRPCHWKHFLDSDNVKALPRDGQPITKYADLDDAWLEIYCEIKKLITTLRETHRARPSFITELNHTDLKSSKPVLLQDTFTFPRLTKRVYTTTTDLEFEELLETPAELLAQHKAVIHGPERSGKTALARYLTLSHIDDEKPVLYADLSKSPGRIGKDYIRARYQETFHGDYDLWQPQDGKTLIVDNMAHTPGLVEFITLAMDLFTNVFVFVSSDVFHSYIFDEKRLAEFHQVRIDPLTYAQQEDLIRKGLTSLQLRETLDDGFVDNVERRVNAIIISSKIVPRYPFFVLSILQTYDSLMNRSLSITSYGHCYSIFIVASLVRAGISDADEALNTCFNFLEHLALAIYQSTRYADLDSFDFSEFVSDYRDTYILENALLNRLTHNEYGILTDEGRFKTTYMYYYFLGQRMGTDSAVAASLVPDLCAESYTEENYLILVFAIHHATDNAIIDEILLRTMVDVEDLDIATLDTRETARFSSLVAALPKSVISDEPVKVERAKERQRRQDLEDEEVEELSVEEPDERERDPARMLRVLKNNRVMGQVLRNRYGRLPRAKIEDIVELIADSSFRLINLYLKDEDEIHRLAASIHARHPEASLSDIQFILQAQSFLWTIYNVEHAVHAVTVPSIRASVDKVVSQNMTPIYEIFGYFFELDIGDSLTMAARDKLADLYRRYSDDFVRRVLSIRTQSYINTHRSSHRVEQSIHSVLGIKYRPRPRSIRQRSRE